MHFGPEKLKTALFLADKTFIDLFVPYESPKVYFTCFLRLNPKAKFDTRILKSDLEVEAQRNEDIIIDVHWSDF